ncbi:hypothetical protein NESM_000716600 [Novymonas esmeraldas]|uniref:Uncharacterized protein n=1 Tax=Novymonas esmeraldas TaxID=1808958 RepID=A0AAW0EWY7_9TRYP
MERYEDSFETATTASDSVGDESARVHSSSSPASTAASSSASAKLLARDDADVPAVSPPPTRQTVLPIPAAPARVLVPVPMPVPALVSAPSSPWRSRQSGDDAASTSLSQPPGTDQHPRSVAAEREGPEASRTVGSTRQSASSSSSSGDASSAAHSGDGGSGHHRRPQGMNFEALAGFVAFGGSGSVGTAGVASQRPSTTAGGTAVSANSFPLGRPPTGRREMESERPSARAAATAAAGESPPQHRSSSESKAVSAAPSSAFSTLSQHLREAPQPPRLATPPLASAAAASSAPSLSVSALPAARQVVEVPPHPRTSPPHPPPPTAAVAPAPPAAAPPPLPALPAPAWAPPPPPTTVVSAPAATDAAAAATRHDWMISDTSYRASSAGATAHQHVPPLPPPPDHQQQQQQQWRSGVEQPRTSELREASEAVERLVRAFAVLRGVGGLRHGAHGDDATTTRAPTSAHRAGAESTVQVRQTTRPRGPRGIVAEAPLPAATQDPRAHLSRPGGHERLAEGLVLDCVLGLLHEHARSTATAAAASSPATAAEDGQSEAAAAAVTWQAARPHYAVVRAEDFIYGAGTTGGRPRGSHAAAAPQHIYSNPSSGVAGALGGAPLFDPRDRQSATDLYNAVREALAKYVLRRVAGSPDTTSQSSTSPPPPAPLSAHRTASRAAAITAVFAWSLLLDVASVCEEVARVAYGAVPDSASAVYPVLVQFRGDAACEDVVKAAMHCLPFEALSSSSGGGDAVPSGDGGGCLFSMACWVTQRQLWTLADAVLDTVREDMTRRARARQYDTLAAAAADTAVDPRLLVPPNTPLLTLRPLPGRRSGDTAPVRAGAPDASTTAASYARVVRGGGSGGPAHVDGEAAGGRHFAVPDAALHKVAHAVSALSTDLLSSAGTGKDVALSALVAEDYLDTATAVAETLSELLQDESIKAAVQRRAGDRLRTAKMARTASVTATRQRKEQAIIDRAEREAEEVVQHILQEMRAQGVA